MSWNPVLNKFIEIKNEYKKRIGYITYYYKDGFTDESQTCVERWVEHLNGIEPFDQYKEYEDLLDCLEMNQYGTMLLVRYGRYSNIYDEEIEVSGEDFWDRYGGFYRECRSVVIDIETECIVLCPFSKFFNINELEETSIENVQKRIEKANYVEFSDKLDGSMQSARWYKNQIVMAGSQAINPENSWRLQDGYRMIYEIPNYEQMLKKFPTFTFIFEYISLKDAHVVKYKKEQESLYLIGMRDINTGVELPYATVITIANEYGIRATRIFDKTLEEVMNELDDKSSDEAEGFVINIDGYKVKIKYNDYVNIHKAISKLSSINLIIRSIADNRYDDLLSKLPVAYHENVKRVASIVFNYIKETENKINEYYNSAPKENKKGFMIYISRHVPKEFQGYCREKFLGHAINVIKGGNERCPHYKRLKDMGIENYNSIFNEEKLDA